MNDNKLALTPEQIPLFLRAIAHNRRVILEQIRTGRFCDADIYFVVEQDGEYVLLPPVSEGYRRDAELARSFNDYLAGSLIGALPFAARHGSDGIKVSSTGKVTQVELKLCMKSTDRYTINENGYITVQGSKKVVGPRSDCSACYEIGNNLASKDVDTYFVIYDGKKHELITIRKMDGKDIVKRLAKIAPKDTEKAKKLSISLAAFIEEGEEVFLDFIDSVGIEAWEERIYDREGKTRPTGAPNSKWTDEMEEELFLLGEAKILSYDEIAKVFGVSKSAIGNKLRRVREARKTA